MMDGDQQRAALGALIERDGASLAALSRMLRRNPAWLQQYLRRGTPRLLPEPDRGLLARFFGVDEGMLGGPAAALVRVPRLAVAASAGPGRFADDLPAIASAGYWAEDLARLGVEPANASEIAVSGDSMAPTLCDGDRILVDRGQRGAAARGAIWVIRIDDAIRVKRLVAEGKDWRIVSDHPDWLDEARPRAMVEVIGRVVELRRGL